MNFQQELRLAHLGMQNYDTIHEAMALLGALRWRVAQKEASEKLTRAINYLRESAYNSLPWNADVLSNRDSYGRRHGRFV